MSLNISVKQIRCYYKELSALLVLYIHHKNGEVLVVDEAHTLNLYQSKASLNLQNC